MKKHCLRGVLTLCLALCLAAGLFFLLPQKASATTYSGSCGDSATWSLNIDTETLTISGSGYMEWSFSGYMPAPWLEYREHIETVIIENGVTSIGYRAFDDCTNLTSITLSGSVIDIEDNAFCGCSGLETIEFSDWNPIYYSSGNCLIEIPSRTLVAGCKSSVIPSYGSVTSIGPYAFYGCTGLTSITVPDSVTSIGPYAFYGCTSLASVAIGNGVTSIEGDAFYSCTGLADVYYGGTQSMWNSINTSSGNDCLTNVEIRFAPHQQHSYVGVVTPSTCTEGGYTTYTCSVCKDSYVTDETPALGHSFTHYVSDHNGTIDILATKTAECDRCGVTDTLPDIASPVAARLVLDSRVGVKFYFNPEDVTEAFTYQVTLAGKEVPITSGTYDHLTEEAGYKVLFFTGIGPEDFMTEFTITGSTIYDPDNAAYNTVLKLAELGVASSQSGSKSERLFRSIADLGRVAHGDAAVYGLNYTDLTPQSSGQGPEAGAALTFTGKNLLMEDALGLRLYGLATSQEEIDQISVLVEGEDVTSHCGVSQGVYDEGIGKYRFTLDLYLCVKEMDEEMTILVQDSAGRRCLSLTDRLDWVAKGILTREPENALAREVLIYIQAVNAYVRKEVPNPVIPAPDPGIETPIGDFVGFFD